METKVCNSCGIEKNIFEFGKLKNSKDGLTYKCKECNNKKSREYRKNNPEKILEQNRKWLRKNPEWIYNRQKKWRVENRDKANEMKREWLNKNPEKRLQYRKNYKPRKNELRRERKENDPLFHIVVKVRSRIWKYLKILNITKKNKTFEIVGCTPLELKEHLEKRFMNGMTWDNRNEWHIDHIIPLSSAKSEKELYRLCHYTNLQPLWAKDNIKKGSRIQTDQI